ncbi:hypothetical protein SeMB42_g03513 [Synchytrium endobioticum]|uniref:F5/8 type C domain-containing protein n=1 Tax=Synchytrium endobioticum TaxID=286115 RepID=A0A507D076_9FUNG|nr:hypothetical protein SeLEV6574_g04279 [Synchytrium endobioticum]TPX46993.1 hypothetical protein SeMB42_g03513 [Synchytrium endobioticum]
MKSAIVLTAAATMFSGIHATIDMNTNLGLNPMVTASSTDAGSDPIFATLPLRFEANGTMTPATLQPWRSKMQATCETQVTYDLDWSAAHGPQMVGLTRIQYGERPAGSLLVSCINNGQFVPTGAMAVPNTAEGYLDNNIEKTGTVPTCTGVRFIFSQLKANNGTCYVSVGDIDVYPSDGRIAGATGNTTTGATGNTTTGASSAASKIATGSAVGLVAVIAALAL